jgi:GTP-binding protein HflX
MQLVEAFRSTLEETTYADAIILVLDLSDTVPEVRRKLQASMSIIREIGAAAAPLIIALNKIDLLSNEQIQERQKIFSNLFVKSVPVSAKTGLNIDELEKEVSEILGEYVEAIFRLHNTSEGASLIHELYDEADSVNTVQREEGSVDLIVKTSPRIAEKLRERVERAGGVLVSYKSLTGCLS